MLGQNETEPAREANVAVSQVAPPAPSPPVARLVAAATSEEPSLSPEPAEQDEERRRSRRRSRRHRRSEAATETEAREVSADESAEEEIPADLGEPTDESTVDEEPSPPPEPALGGTGYLTVVTDPGTRVYLNSRLIGTSSVDRREVPSGRHTVYLMSGDLPARRMTVVVRPNEVTRVSQSLRSSRPSTARLASDES
jgi:hypothetical protein